MILKLTLKVIAVFYSLLPLWARVLLGNTIGFLLEVSSFRKEVVRQNLELCYPGESQENTRTEIENGFYREFGKLICELFYFFFGMKRFIRNHVTLEGREHIDQALAQGKGLIFLASHMGNWEVMSAKIADSGYDSPLMITKRLKPPSLHEAIEKGRASYSVYGTYEPRTSRDVLAQLKKNRSVGIVLDQYTGPPVGVRVPFFGQIVGTHSVVALFVKRSGAPVVPLINTRLKDGSFLVRAYPEIKFEVNEDAGEMMGINTARYAEVIESWVRANPAQWLWTHRRFKGDLSPLKENEWREGRARG